MRDCRDDLSCSHRKNESTIKSATPQKPCRRRAWAHRGCDTKRGAFSGSPTCTKVSQQHLTFAPKFDPSPLQTHQYIYHINRPCTQMPFKFVRLIGSESLVYGYISGDVTRECRIFQIMGIVAKSWTLDEIRTARSRQYKALP